MTVLCAKVSPYFANRAMLRRARDSLPRLLLFSITPRTGTCSISVRSLTERTRLSSISIVNATPVPSRAPRKIVIQGVRNSFEVSGSIGSTPG